MFIGVYIVSLLERGEKVRGRGKGELRKFNLNESLSIKLFKGLQSMWPFCYLNFNEK